MQNILIWLGGRAVKQIVLIRLFAATDGYPISVKNEFKKNIFSFFYIFFSKKYFFKIHFLKLIGYPSFAANSLISNYLQLSFDSSTTKPDQDILHAIFLQLAAVIRDTFTLFLLNFPQMLELVGSYVRNGLTNKDHEQDKIAIHVAALVS